MVPPIIAVNNPIIPIPKTIDDKFKKNSELKYFLTGFKVKYPKK
jgi:hypothetical protein